MNYQELAKEFGGSAEVSSGNTEQLVNELEPIKKAETGAPVDYSLMAQEFGGVVEPKPLNIPPNVPPVNPNPAQIKGQENQPTSIFQDNYSGNVDFNNLSLQNPPKNEEQDAQDKPWYVDAYVDTKDFIHELFTADKRKIGGLEHLKQLKDMPFPESKILGMNTGLSQGLRREQASIGSMAAGSNKEVADIYSHQLGRNPETGKYSKRKTIGDYELVWNPHDEKWYSDKVGLTFGDVEKAVGTVGLEVMTGRLGMSLATKVPSIAGKINKLKKIADSNIFGAAGKEAVTQGVHEVIQENTGGEANVRDTVIAGGVGGTTRTIGKAKEAFSSAGANKKAIINAHQNGGFAELRKLHKDNPDSLNASLQEYGFKEYDPKKGLVLERDVELALKDMAEGGGEMQQLANAIRTSPEALKAFKKGKLPFTSREIIDENDFHSKKLLDSYRKEAGSKTDSIGDQAEKNLIDTTEIITNRLDNIRKTSNAEELSDNIREVMKSTKDGYEESYNKHYSELDKHIPKDFTYKAEKTLAYLNSKIDAFRPKKVPDGYVLKDGSKVDNPLDTLSPTERDIYKKLSPKEYEYKPSNTGTVVGSQNKVEGATKRTVVTDSTSTKTKDSIDAVTGKRTPNADINVGNTRIISSKGDDLVVEGGSKLSKSGDARNVDITGQGKPDITHDTKYTTIDQLRKDVGSKIGAINVSNQENADFSKLYSLLTEEQDDAIESIGNMGHEANKLWNDAKDAFKMKKGVEKDMESLFGKAFDDETQKADFVKKLSSSVKDLGKGSSSSSSSKFINMVNAVPEGERKKFVSDAILYSIEQEGGSFDLKKFGKWYSNLKNNKKMMAFLGDNKNMDKTARKFLNNLGEASKAMNMKKSTDGTTDYMKKILLGKENGVKQILSSTGLAVAAGAGVQAVGLGLGSIGLGAVGGYMLSMQILQAFRKAAVGNADKAFEKSVDIINSKELKNLLMSGVKTKDLRNLSSSKKMMEWAKQAGIAKNRTELETWLTKAFRVSNDAGKEEYESREDLQKP